VTGALVVIPARYGSSRFPGKALADLAGRPLVVRVAERAARMREAAEVVVATDDARIRDAVVAAGFAAELTGEHATGTDRVGEVAARRTADIIVNLQGDEPLLDPAEADRLVSLLRADPFAGLATLAHPLADADEWRDPNVVKVLLDRADRALYFSRAPLPGAFPGRDARGERLALRHIGIYAWRRGSLARFVSWSPTPLEIAEGLEQLRALEHGLPILVARTDHRPVGVDTAADLEHVRRLWTA
jgi:3-deoxy-manno-octulosonate cytidylyltransferase (CMP-KDO synthetase)